MQNAILEKAAISSKGPGANKVRATSSLREEIERAKAGQVNPKPAARRGIDGFVVKDIFEAAYLAAYGVEPRLALSDDKAVYLFPLNEQVLMLRENYRKSYIKTQDLAEQVRRLQALARQLRK